MATIDTLKEILNDNLDIDPESITPATTFESLGIDSLDMVELMTDVEARLDIELGEPDDIATVGDLVAYIDGMREGEGHAE